MKVRDARIAIDTMTLAGLPIVVSELSMKHIPSIYQCLADQRFTMPYLTGHLPERSSPARRWVRAADYVFLRAMASRMLGRRIFGARRHWIMAIEERASKRFLGVAMLDGVVRLAGPTSTMLSHFVIEKQKTRTDEQIGDSEWGFFLHPNGWGQGIALQAMYALTAALAEAKSWCAPEGGIVRRVWAETGEQNHAARRLLEKAGLAMNPARSTPIHASKRYTRDGEPIALVCYEHPVNDALANPDAPVKTLLARLESERSVRPGWSIRST